MAYGRSLATWKMRFLVMSSRASESVANTSASSSSVLIDNGNEDFFVICCRISPSTWINSKTNIRLHIHTYVICTYIYCIGNGHIQYSWFHIHFAFSEWLIKVDLACISFWYPVVWDVLWSTTQQVILLVRLIFPKYFLTVFSKKSFNLLPLLQAWTHWAVAWAEKTEKKPREDTYP